MWFSLYVLILFAFASTVNDHVVSDPETFATVPDQDHEVVNKAHNLPISSTLFYGKPHLLTTVDQLTGNPREITAGNEWMLLAIFVSLLSVAFAWFHFAPEMALTIKSVIGVRFFYQLVKDAQLLNQVNSYLLFANYVMVLALLSYQVMDQLFPVSESVPAHPLVIYGILLAALIFFYLLKALIINLIAWVFNTRKASLFYFEHIFVSNVFIGLLFMPLVFYNAFSPSISSIYFMMVLLLLANIYKLIRGAILSYGASGFSVFYLFLYLCGVELAPLLVIYKLLFTYLSAL